MISHGPQGRVSRNGTGNGSESWRKSHGPQGRVSRNLPCRPCAQFCSGHGPQGRLHSGFRGRKREH